MSAAENTDGDAGVAMAERGHTAWLSVDEAAAELELEESTFLHWLGSANFGLRCLWSRSNNGNSAANFHGRPRRFDRFYYCL